MFFFLIQLVAWLLLLLDDGHFSLKLTHITLDGRHLDSVTSRDSETKKGTDNRGSSW